MTYIDPRSRAPLGATVLYRAAAAAERLVAPMVRLWTEAARRARVAKMSPRQRLDVGLPADGGAWMEIDQIARILGADRR